MATLTITNDTPGVILLNENFQQTTLMNVSYSRYSGHTYTRLMIPEYIVPDYVIDTLQSIETRIYYALNNSEGSYSPTHKWYRGSAADANEFYSCPHASIHGEKSGAVVDEINGFLDDEVVMLQRIRDGEGFLEYNGEYYYCYTAYEAFLLRLFKKFTGTFRETGLEVKFIYSGEQSKVFVGSGNVPQAYLGGTKLGGIYIGDSKLL